MARTKAPKAEGVDRQVEGVDFAVSYVELRKPEVTEVLENPLEGYDSQPPNGTRQLLDGLMEQRAEDRATVGTGTELWFLWNKQTAETWMTGYRPHPWQALAQRELGFARYRAHARQERGGLIPPGAVTAPYRTVCHVDLDLAFDREADYLAAQDQLSEPFVEALAGPADEAFCGKVLDVIRRRTKEHGTLDHLVLQAPGELGTSAGTVSIAGGEDELPDFIQALTDPGGPLEGADFRKPFSMGIVVGSEFGVCEHRGTASSIPELSGTDWAMIQAGRNIPNQRELMESIAARIGHGARVYVEGVTGQAKVLIPIKFGFAQGA